MKLVYEVRTVIRVLGFSKEETNYSSFLFRAWSSQTPQFVRMKVKYSQYTSYDVQTPTHIWEHVYKTHLANITTYKLQRKMS